MKRLTVDEAVKALKNGELVIVPTETVYGLAADGLNEQAIKNLYEVKGRPAGKPIMMQVSDLQMVRKIVKTIPSAAEKIIDKFWPGPVSLVLSKKASVSSILSAGGSTIGVRMPNHQLTLEIIRKVGQPLAVPSANISGQKSPRNAEQAAESLKGLPIAGIVDGGDCQFGIESTIVDCTGDEPKILRKGAIGEDQIMAILKMPVSQADQAQH